MEIIKKGTPPGDRKRETTCDNCDSVLKFKQSEAQRHSDQRDGDYYSINCPVCGKTINVDARLFGK